MPTMDTYRFRKLSMKILQYAERLGFDLHATTIQLTKDLMTKPHKDVNNRGPSGIFGLGNWSGGETFVQDQHGKDYFTLTEDIEGIGKSGDTLQGVKLDIHNLQQFDGNLVHCTLPFVGRRYAIVLFSLGRSYDETPALARAFLQELGFRLPPANFQEPMQPNFEALASMAAQGLQVEDEAGRHAPPAGRRPDGRASASRASRPKRARAASPEVLELPEWTPEQVETLRSMKKNKKAKYVWAVVASRLKMTVPAAKKKWEEIRS